jgi:hypothetical protein
LRLSVTILETGKSWSLVRFVISDFEDFADADDIARLTLPFSAPDGETLHAHPGSVSPIAVAEMDFMVAPTFKPLPPKFR